MKITKLLLTAITLTVPMCAYSAVSVDQALSREYIMNSGFSEQTYEAVTVERNRGVGKEYYTKDERKYNKSSGIKKFFRNLYTYTDPAQDDFSFYHHNHKSSPSYTDL